MAIDLIGPSSTPNSGGRGNKVNNEQQSTTGKAGGSGGAQPSVNQAPVDTVKISEAALAAQNVAKELKSEPEVNSDRVAELKAAIDSGEYKVNAERVADRMLAFEDLFR
ncbi:flagellar biosynthesis anti-sigma factor FlgM [Marinobacterium sp. YM272]|uniref:flagellar biosynthesis anti-sigma factor FlgM n=1 Tax=Marinobacterium sp. YM272 TaxID=3421654 RepID=UPI003D7FF1EF